MTWVRNPHYNVVDPWAIEGKAAGIDFDIGIDPAQAALKIKAGDIDIYTGQFTTADVAQLSNDASLSDRVFVSERPATLTMFLNNTVAPFDNVKVREAVNYGDQPARRSNGCGVVRPSARRRTRSCHRRCRPTATTTPTRTSPIIEKAKKLMEESGVEHPGHDHDVEHATTSPASWRWHRSSRRTWPRSASTSRSKERSAASTKQADARPGGEDADGHRDVLDGLPGRPGLHQPAARSREAGVRRQLCPLRRTSRSSPSTKRVAVPRPVRSGRQAYLDLDEKVMTEAAPWAPLLDADPVRLRVGTSHRLRVQRRDGQCELQHDRCERTDVHQDLQLRRASRRLPTQPVEVRDPDLVLEVTDLGCRIPTEEGTVRRRSGPSRSSLLRVRCLGVVGESGSGKSATALAMIGLAATPLDRERIGQTALAGNCVGLPAARHAMCCAAEQVAMMFQDPMTALNPMYSVGWQVAEVHPPPRSEQARAVDGSACWSCSSLVGLANPTSGRQHVSASALRRECDSASW